MTQEDKDLLLRDLCGRLPYEVKLQYESQYGSTCIGPLTNINPYKVTFGGICKDILEVKPYLFPFSSMTEKQKKELLAIMEDESDDGVEYKVVDFYSKNHIDYRGLIPKGLALDVSGLNIY